MAAVINVLIDDSVNAAARSVGDSHYRLADTLRVRSRTLPTAVLEIHSGAELDRRRRAPIGVRMRRSARILHLRRRIKADLTLSLPSDDHAGRLAVHFALDIDKTCFR